MTQITHGFRDMAAILGTMTSRIALAAALVALALPATASAATPDAILSNLAANQTHSWIDDGIGFDAMEAKYKRGERLYVTCGNVAEVGRRLLVEAGYEARVVQTITREPFDYYNDGHLMTEVFDGGRWVLYDVDANGKAVNANGTGVGVDTQVRAVQAGTAHWRPIASDPLYFDGEPDPQHLESARRDFANIDGLYRRLLGTAMIPRDPNGTISQGTYFDAPDQVQRLAAYAGSAWQFVSDTDWVRLTTTTDGLAPAPPAAPAAAAATSAAPAPSAAPAAPTATHAAKVKPKRRYRTKVRHGKVFHVYGHGRKARWVYVRRVHKNG